jgi:putative ABC transport system permease protein
MNTVLNDFRFACRMLLKSPGSTLAALFALTLGIGANSAIFSVVNAVLLRPVRYASPDRLAILWGENPSRGIHEFPASPPNYRDWVDRNRSFDVMAAFRVQPAILTGTGEPERLDAAVVSPRLFDLLGVHPALGRAFLPEEDQPGHDRVVVLSHGLWLRRFGGDRSILGRAITIDGGPYQVVGVADPGFRLLDTPSELWRPYVLDSKELSQRGFYTLKVLARLKPGVTLDQARQDLAEVARGLEQQYPDINAGWTINPVLVRDQLVGNIRPTLLTLFAAVGFVLLISCSNVAILLLARAGARQKEVAIRSALGASRIRIVRQMLTESLLLSLAAGVSGLLLAWAGIAALAALRPANIPRFEEISIDWQVVRFTFGVCVLTGLLFGMVPATTVVRSRLNDILRIAGRSSMASLQARRTRAVLVVSEIALSIALLIGAGLMIRSFAQLQSVNPGFRPDHVLTMELALPESRYEGLRIAKFYQRLVAAIQPLPGVRSAAVARNVPLGGGDRSLNFVIENRPPLASTDQPRARYRSVSADYFAALGVPLLKGRWFSPSDSESSQPVAIINDKLARRFWPNEDPIGKRMKAGFDGSLWSTIVGIVGDVKYAGLDSETQAEMYYPYLQVPPALMNLVEASMTVVVRVEGDPAMLAEAIRREVRSLDPNQPIFHVRTMEQLLDGSIAQPRFRALLLGVFAAVALALAVVGLYGVISYSVSQRSGEMGLRAALGANQGDLLRLVLGEGARLLLAGVAIGIAMAFGLAQALSKLLYGVRPVDPATFVVTPLVLFSVALIAIYIPARRASRTDPCKTLSSDC